MRLLYQLFIILDRYKAIIIIIMFSATLVSGFLIYVDIKHSIISALSNTVNLYIDGISEPKPSPYLEIASILGKLTLFVSVFIVSIKSWLASLARWISVREGDHILVIGLDSRSRFFVDSEIKKGNKNIVVVENDEYNPYIEIYRARAISVIQKEIESVIDHIGIDSARYIFVSTGDSEENISTALKIMDKAEKNLSKKLIVHIEDRTLRSLYNDESLLGNNQLDVRPFSYHKESARMLFQEHSIDGEGMDIIDSDRAFEIAVVGDSNLAIEVIVEAIKMSHLPNENRLIINCIDRDIKAFEERIKYEIPYIEEVKHIKLNYISLDYRSIDFYKHVLWTEDALKHIVLCYDQSITNINVSTKLKRVTYNGVIDNTIRKIHIATYDHIEISREIKKYSKENDDMFIFAAANLVCATDNLIDTDMEQLAKMIEYSYNSTLYDRSSLLKSKKRWEGVWEQGVTINDKRSSIAQAKHINMKLKFLGLKRIKSDKSIEELVRQNREKFDTVLQKDREYMGLGEDQIRLLSEELERMYKGVSYTTPYFPKEYNTMFEKILRAEHNRWIAMLVMMDNQYSKLAKGMDKKDRKIKKIHHLMKTFEEFTEDEKPLILYDIYSLLYIPEYLACLGEEIVELKYQQ